MADENHAPPQARARVGEGGRRLQPAGRRGLIGAVLISLVLNAPGLHKSADPTRGLEAGRRPSRSARRAEQRVLSTPRRAEGRARPLGGRRHRHRGRRSGRAGADRPSRPAHEAASVSYHAAAPAPRLDRGGLARRRARRVDPPCRHRAASSSRSGRWTAGSRAGSSGPTSSTGSGTCGTSPARRTRARSSSCSAATTTTGFMTGVPEGVEIGSFGSESWTGSTAGGSASSWTPRQRGAYLVWIGLADNGRSRADAALRRHQRDRPVRGCEAAAPAVLPRHVLPLRRHGRRLRAVRLGLVGETREDARRRRRALRAGRGRPHRPRGPPPLERRFDLTSWRTRSDYGVSPACAASGMGPVAQLVFKTSAVVQPTARSVRLRRRSAELKPRTDCRAHPCFSSDRLNLLNPLLVPRERS